MRGPLSALIRAQEALNTAEAHLRALPSHGIPADEVKWSAGALRDAASEIRGLITRYSQEIAA